MFGLKAFIWQHQQRKAAVYRSLGYAAAARQLLKGLEVTEAPKQVPKSQMIHYQCGVAEAEKDLLRLVVPLLRVAVNSRDATETSECREEATI